MHLRKDAGSALIHCCHNIIPRFERVRSADSVWNFGVVSFAPGAGNVVPSETAYTGRIPDIRPVRRGGAIWSPENLKTLYGVCHLEEHGKTSHKVRKVRTIRLSEWDGFARRPDSPPAVKIQPSLF